MDKLARSSVASALNALEKTYNLITINVIPDTTAGRGYSRASIVNVTLRAKIVANLGQIHILVL